MVLRETGVRLVVAEFNKYMRQLRQATTETDTATRKINAAMKREAAVRRKLGQQMREQNKILEELATKNIPKTSEAYIEAATKMQGYSAQLESSRVRTAGLAEATKGLAGALGPLAGMAGTLLPILAGIFLIVAPLIVAFQFLSRVLKILTGIIKIVIKVLKVLFTIVKFLAGGFIKLAKDAIGLFIKALTGIVGFLGKAFIAILRTIVNLAKKLASGFLSAAKSIFEFAKNLFRVVSQSVLKMLRKLADVLGDIIEQAWAGAEAFQRLSIRFQGLVANELKAADATLDFAEAMEMAVRPSEALLQWMQKLAVTTPFSRADISETVAFSMAMGFTSEKAQELTLAIGNFVSGMGLSSEVMERVILQFGQMQAGGKLFGTELRDLARGAFVPVNDIIKKVAENLDMAAGEWQELAATGETSILPFFEEFINMANTRFPNAMERMNNTLTAVKQNIQDFVTEFLGVKALGPVVEIVSKRVNKMLDELLAPEVMAAFQELGRHISALVGLLLDVGEAFTVALFGMKKVPEAIKAVEEDVMSLGKVMGDLKEETDDVLGTWSQIAIQIAAFISVVAGKITKALFKVKDDVDDFGKTMGEKAVEAFEWGVNIIGNLAEGIIKGAATVLTWAMNTISNLLAMWLGPGSPPMVAPDLPAWGESALLEWLKGMTSADFGVLTAIQSPLRGALDALMAAGELTRNQVGPLFAEISRGLIEGFAGGAIGQDVFKLIQQSMGEFSSEIINLINKQLALKEAVEEVTEAEERLARARERHTELTAKVAEETAEYNRLLREGAGKTELRAQMQVIRNAQKQRGIAADQIDEASDQLEVAEERRDELADEVSLQDQILRQLIEITRAQHDFVEETQKALKGLKGGADAIEEIEAGVTSLGGALGGLTSNLTKAFTDARNDILQAWEDLFGPLGDRWNEDIKPALAELKLQFKVFKAEAIDPILAAFGIGPSAMDVDLAELGTLDLDMPEGVQTLEAKIRGIGEALKTLVADVKAIAGDLWSKVLPDIWGMFKKLLKALGLLDVDLGTFKVGTWDEFVESVSTFSETTWTEWMAKLDTFRKETLGGPDGVIQRVLDLYDRFAGSNGLTDELDHIRTVTMPKVNELFDALGGFIDAVSNFLGIEDDEGSAVGGFSKLLKIFDGIVGIAIWVVGFFTDLVTKLDEMKKVLEGIGAALLAIKSAWDNVKGIFPNLPNWIPGVPFFMEHGAIDVPSNITANLHAGEMVIPAPLASQIRRMIAAPPAVSQNSVQFGDIHVNNGMDQAGVQGMLNNWATSFV